MHRRKFLKYLSISTAIALFPMPLSAMGNTDNTLYVFIQASGGWDVTSLCDPKGYLSSEIDKNNRVSSSAMNKSYAQKDIIKLSNGISYPPISVDTHGNSHGVVYDYANFFDKYEKELLIINGIDTQTNSHSSGRRYMMSGNLSEGYPAISALIAGARMPSSPLAFITSGGYDFTDGFVAGTRVSNASILTNLAQNNKKNDTESFMSPSANTRLKKMREERILRLIDKSKLASVKEQMQEFHLAHSGSSELIKLVENLNKLDTNLDEYAKTNSVFSQGRFAMAGFKAGLTAAVNISYGGFDTHGDNDRKQLSRLSKLLQGIDLLKQEAQNLGIDKDVVYIIGSEFARTPKYNANNGKDHWRVNSMMFMGKGINKNGVIGSTSHEHQIYKINPSTLQKDDKGIKINFAHINKALRKLAGLSDNAQINKYYPLAGNIEDLALFS